MANGIIAVFLCTTLIVHAQTQLFDEDPKAKSSGPKAELQSPSRSMGPQHTPPGPAGPDGKARRVIAENQQEAERSSTRFFGGGLPSPSLYGGYGGYGPGPFTSAFGGGYPYMQPYGYPMGGYGGFYPGSMGGAYGNSYGGYASMQQQQQQQLSQVGGGASVGGFSRPGYGGF